MALALSLWHMFSRCWPSALEVHSFTSAITSSFHRIKCRHNLSFHSFTCWHNSTCFSRFNVSCSGGWWNFTIVQLQAAFQRCLSVLLSGFVGRRL
ncbi:hypothetical protein BKA91DRAFT_133744 [Yarrowia lipolytica]|nr:hypothetical protein BKA91DRAFT_133744 [Yarrowia lipolytica]KAE8170840.1 hypothetical protein BKA90DRAFT_140059 [Yarrowia lipolytica]RMI97326.1 hypothetical protein BD777DRAFT_127073 [Yarrowia lipolytica]